ncbi:MAG: sodium:solute symporter family protein [Elusimicrobium sp.]|jgi:SSS family solute:Na+ symporter|nr:sodium:solute symporter family protein [Elusimicrobium sp.]
MKESLIVYNYLGAADWVVFFVILALTFGAAFYGHWLKTRTAGGQSSGGVLEYMLMGRKLTLPMFVATLSATWYGGIFGVNEITHNYGIYNFITQGVFWYAAYIIFALFIVKKISKHNSVTLPELAGTMFGPRSAKTAAFFTFFYILPVAYVLSVGIFLNLLFGMSVLKGMMLGGLFTCMYSAWGGFRAVVFSEIVQFVTMCAAVLIVLLFSLHAFGGYHFLRANLPAGHFSLTGGNTFLNTIIWGFIALATLVDPSFYQRVFAADSTKTARNGVLICTLVWICFDICTTAGALYARALLPNAVPAHAYFLYSVQLLPAGLKGFFAAGILALILSTVDSFTFIAANTVSYDFLRHKFKNVVTVNRLAMFGVAALSIVLALLMNGSFKTIWLTLGSYMSACLLIPLLYGYVRPGRISDGVFTFSAITSAAAMTVWSATAAYHFELDGFYIGLLTSIIILTVSLWKKR